MGRPVRAIGVNPGGLGGRDTQSLGGGSGVSQGVVLGVVNGSQKTL